MHAPDRDMQTAQSLNLNWYFRKGFNEEIIEKPLEKKAEENFERVHVPHTVQMVPYDCFDQNMTCMVSTYVKYFDLDSLSGRRVLVSFEGVSACFELYCNAHHAGSHKGAYSMALFDLTAFVREGENRMVLMVDSHERADIPPNGSTVDFLIYGGIYRDVDLYLQEEIYIRQPLVRYEITAQGVMLKPELLVTSCGSGAAAEKKKKKKEEREITVKCEIREVCPIEDAKAVRLLDHHTDAVLAVKAVCTAAPGDQSLFPGEWVLPVPGTVRLWEPETPVLYEVFFSLEDEHGRVLDTARVKTGFRSIRVEAGGFFLNGKKRKLIGLNRHQSYPYIGYALGKRAQEADAELMKDFLGLDMVRCSHYMQSDHFLNRCDELGLMVFEEIPGWGYIGDEAFRQIVFQDLKSMVLGHFNHPSVVIWGSRLNETADCDELYEKTYRLCKEMDPSRPATGARWHTGSRLIEDIYSFNDYSEDERGEFVLLTSQEASKTDQKVPYLVSEHSGAILPTKPWDSEERQEQFALRHARVLQKILTMEDYLGALGWCLCDYNTHNDHNSMNKICYHGVLDMFRVPKMAAYLYASQKPPQEQVILEPCSMVGRGERCEPVPFWVMTNCDYIDVTLSSDETRRYYPSVKLGGLLHPPIEVKENGEFWQTRWTGAKITGYVDGRPAAERIYSDNPVLSPMQVRTDGTVIPDRRSGDGTGKDPGIADGCRILQKEDVLVLKNDRTDEARIVVYFVDENGNRLYFHRDVLRVETEGEIEVIGPTVISAMGGAAAFWVRSKAGGCSRNALLRLYAQREEAGSRTIRIRLVL